MGSGIFFPVCAIPIILIIIIIFNVKGHIESKETKIYNLLIISNLIGLIIELLCSFACEIYLSHPIISSFILKTYLVYLIVWTAIFTMYIFTITLSKFKKSYKYIHYVALMVIVIIIYILPIDVIVKNNFQIRYTAGLSVNFSYFISFFYVLAIFIVLFKNIKKIKSKKYLPVFLFIIIGTISIIIQKIYPQFLLFTYAETLICLCMYFTIENPDVRMLREVTLAKIDAEKANNAKTEFLSNMSHEIRTPLNAIVGFSQALLEEDLPDSTKEEVKDIVMASDTLLEIVNGILDISKIEANKLEIIKTEYNIEKIISELVSLTKTRIGEKPIDFRVDVDPSIPKVLYGDHMRLKQIVLNLLTNAAKYTKEGFIEFKISSVIKNNICRLIISVEDSGIGIKADKIDHLFTKFDRLGVEKSITIEGTGLGLAITKKLIELMHGNIVVQSVYGSGSKFTVAIDQKIVETKAKVVIEKNNLDKEIFDYNGKRILVVDDNKVNLKVAERLLRNYNLDITLVSSGQDCIDKINNGEKYDLILMDDMMPNMSGVETFHKLKTISSFNAPVIALTANAISGMREKYLSEGFDDYLPKPIQKSELNAILVKFLGKER